MNDKQTAKSRCFGFVTMRKEAQAKSILKQEPHYLDGKEVECKLAVPKTQQDSKKSAKKKQILKEEKDQTQISYHEEFQT